VEVIEPPELREKQVAELKSALEHVEACH